MTGLLNLAWSPFDPWHLLVLGAVALLLFGKRLPEVGRSLGRGIAEFKKGLRDVQDELNRDDRDDEERPRQRLRPPEEEREESRRFSTRDDDEPAPTRRRDESERDE